MHHGLFVRVTHVAYSFCPSGLGFSAGQHFAILGAQCGTVSADVGGLNGQSSDTILIHGLSLVVWQFRCATQHKDAQASANARSSRIARHRELGSVVRSNWLDLLL